MQFWRVKWILWNECYVYFASTELSLLRSVLTLLIFLEWLIDYVVINYSRRSMMDFNTARGKRRLWLCRPWKKKKKKLLFKNFYYAWITRSLMLSKNSEYDIFSRMCARSASGRNCGGSWTRALPPMHIAAIDGIQQRNIHEVSGDVVPINMVKGIGHLRDPRLNKVLCIFEIFDWRFFKST